MCIPKQKERAIGGIGYGRRQKQREKHKLEARAEAELEAVPEGAAQPEKEREGTVKLQPTQRKY